MSKYPRFALSIFVSAYQNVWQYSPVEQDVETSALLPFNSNEFYSRQSVRETNSKSLARSPTLNASAFWLLSWVSRKLAWASEILYRKYKGHLFSGGCSRNLVSHTVVIFRKYSVPLLILDARVFVFFYIDAFYPEVKISQSQSNTSRFLVDILVKICVYCATLQFYNFLGIHGSFWVWAQPMRDAVT